MMFSVIENLSEPLNVNLTAILYTLSVQWCVCGMAFLVQMYTNTFYQALQQEEKNVLSLSTFRWSRRLYIKQQESDVTQEA